MAEEGRTCEPAIYEELIRTTSMRKKIEALNAGTRYLNPITEDVSRSRTPPAKGSAKGKSHSERRGVGAAKPADSMWCVWLIVSAGSGWNQVPCPSTLLETEKRPS
jgi:hypothetical protein